MNHWQTIEDALKGHAFGLRLRAEGNISSELAAIDAALAFVREQRQGRQPLPDDVIKDILFLCYNGLEHPAAGRVMRWLDAPTASG